MYLVTGCILKFTQGNRMSDGRSALSDRLEVGCLPPGQKIDISVSMRSPEKPGMYESQWRMATSIGNIFRRLFTKREHKSTKYFTYFPNLL